MLSLLKLGLPTRRKERAVCDDPVPPENREQWYADQSSAGTDALRRRIAELSAELTAEREAGMAACGEFARLTAVIHRIWKARVYETCEPADGVSVDLLDAIRHASLVAGLRRSLPNERETAEPLNQPS